MSARREKRLRALERRVSELEGIAYMGLVPWRKESGPRSWTLCGHVSRSLALPLPLVWRPPTGASGNDWWIFSERTDKT